MRQVNFRCFFRHARALTFLCFCGVQKDISGKKYHHVSKPTMGYVWTKYLGFCFLIICQEISIRLDLSGHSLIRCLLIKLGLTFRQNFFGFNAMATKLVGRTTNIIQQ